MKVKTYRKGSVNYPAASGWVRVTICSRQQTQKLRQQIATNRKARLAYKDSP